MTHQHVNDDDAASRHYSGLNMPKTILPHILIVDDDPQIRDVLQEYFTSNELRVNVASSGKEMMGILVSHSIDLVVLDLRLAGEDGMVLTRRLREESAIPIILLTGVHDEADRIMGLELGADDSLTKPFSPRELLARIRALLRRSRSHETVADGLARIRAYRFAGWELNVRLRRLTSPQSETIPITN